MIYLMSCSVRVVEELGSQWSIGVEALTATRRCMGLSFEVGWGGTAESLPCVS